MLKLLYGDRCRLPAITVLAITTVLSVSDALGQLPPVIQAPGEARVIRLFAQGVQIYECKAGPDGTLAWDFREPIAILIFRGQTVGRRYAGPNWDHIDGSGITGRLVASAPAHTINDIAWAKFEVAAHRGTGVFTDVTTIQRINTAGGVMKGPCNARGVLQSVPYSADYAFLRKSPEVPH
jgi:hypothetical protein